MAQRTITAAGGTFSLLSTWVEGAVPGVNDHIVGLATSGPLILTDSRTVQRGDFTQYQNLLTITGSTGRLLFNTSNATTTFSATMSFLFNNPNTPLTAPANRLEWTANANNARIEQLGTQIIPCLRLVSSGNISRTLLSNLYVKNLSLQDNNTVNGFSIFIDGNLSGSNTTNPDTFQGTTRLFLEKEGIVYATIGAFASSTASITINGTYSSGGSTLRLHTNADLTIATNSNCKNLNLELTDPDTGVNNNISTFSPFNNLYIQQELENSESTRDTTILSEKLICNEIIFYSFLIKNTTQNFFHNFRFLGGGLSASNFITYPISVISTTGSTFEKSPNIALDPGFTHSIGNLYLQGVQGNKSFFTASSAGTVNLIVSGTNSSIINYDFSNINASGGEKLYALGGVLTNTTNIDNVLPTGGTGGTGSVAGPYAFATIN